MKARILGVLAFLLPIVSASYAQILSSVRIASGLTQPVGIVGHPTDPNILFIVQQNGLIRVIQNGVLLSTPFLNLQGQISTGSERGLLGLAFDPNFTTNRRFYVNFTNPSGHTVVARFKVSESNPLVADPNSRFDFRWGGPTGNRWIVQPFSNHNGGNLMFGPDGYLYIGLGDGGSAGDPGNRAQDPNTWLGKMLRIDVNVPDSDPEGYVVPPDNPFLDGDPIYALPEIWAFGLRNPWRYSFDDPRFGGTGAMYIADVGQNNWEEVDYEPAGAGGRNYGWRNYEGNAVYNNSLPPAYTPLTFPIHVYSHSDGCSITGGFVYRGVELGCDVFGHYFFSDYCSAQLWTFKVELDAGGNPVVTQFMNRKSEIDPTNQINSVTSFGVDANGELYVADHTGEIFKIVRRRPRVVPDTFSLSRGLVISGGLNDLWRCEDWRLVMRPWIVLSGAEFPIQLVVEGTTPNASPSQLWFVWEAHASIPNITERVELFNFQTQTWEQVNTRTATTSDQRITVQITTNPQRFIEPGTRRMRAKISYKEAGIVLVYPWQARVDETYWDIIP